MADKSENNSPARKPPRDQSTISFPYGDQDTAVEVAHGMMKCGGVPCDADQLAAALGQAPTSGNFRMKIATARIFGVIETLQGKYQLTDLGFAIVDKSREKAARAESFLRVPLYRRMYEEFRNKQLPPRTAPLEHAMTGFGVAPKQKERARQAFERSALSAGFFDQGGKSRLIKPAVANFSLGQDDESGSSKETEDDSGRGVANTGSGSGTGGARKPPPPGFHPFIQGLLATLPEPETTWTVEGRAKWLEAAAKVFDLMYKGDGSISVQVSQSNRATE